MKIFTLYKKTIFLKRIKLLIKNSNFGGLLIHDNLTALIKDIQDRKKRWDKIANLC